MVLIYGTHALHFATPETMKEPRLLKATADLSYDVYLFHWPLYIICSALIINNIAASITTLVVSFAFSAAMVYGAEKVFISNGHGVMCPSNTDKVACEFNAPGSDKCVGISRRRRVITFITVPAVAIAIALCGVVLFRTPDITSIERDFAVSYVLSDTGRVVSLANRVMAENVVSGQSDGDATGTTGGGVDGTGQDPDTAGGDPDVSVSKPPTPEPPTPEPAPPEPEYDLPTGVTLVGDSVSLGAQPALESTIEDIYVDSVVGRQVSVGKTVLEDLQKSGDLREYVVIALGTNGTNSYEKLFTEIIDLIEPGHRIILVTPFDGRSNDNSRATSATAEWMRELPNQYDFVTIADWASLISTQIDILAGDKVHMGGKTSMNLYAECVYEAITAAADSPPKR